MRLRSDLWRVGCDVETADFEQEGARGRDGVAEEIGLRGVGGAEDLDEDEREAQAKTIRAVWARAEPAILGQVSDLPMLPQRALRR
eukprot:172519-Rhodomonas_salina.2